MDAARGASGGSRFGMYLDASACLAEPEVTRSEHVGHAAGSDELLDSRATGDDLSNPRKPGRRFAHALRSRFVLLTTGRTIDAGPPTASSCDD